ncbi:SMP-30/gluconolactonase/LRE family protein [Pseudomaricurvus alkylphenolicus]|uniref:SMP-30/gluconolactonase/LRE family protein n=1 Tax=Pseudomaricurvus alkylphenolicus TaxID=1306991 RepID=UPI00141E50AB|nr:SMP-30/gluconolactonase/LRE family protein [Pseudomaricurvus alkylphenolicus]NIB42467.1 SMP-30/gluconolactonase/LRE family protein [Pseudomaricurvus alkylphenolicus]
MTDLLEVAYQVIKPEIEVVAEGLRFPEGPIALADGSLLVVEIAGKALTRVAADGTLSVIAELEGGPNGAALGPDGWCYICNSGGWLHQKFDDGFYYTVGQSPDNGWIEKVNLQTGEIQTLYDSCDGQPLRAPNDIVFDRAGGFYFTDHGKADSFKRDVTAVYYAAADGSGIREVIRPLLTPNGIGLSPDENILYVAETHSRRLWAFELAGTGEIEPVPRPASVNGGRLVAGLPDGFLLDSLAVDSAGHICVGSIGKGHGGVWDISPDGRCRTFFSMDDPFCTNICFGARDRDAAYVTCSGSGRLVSFKWPRPGASINFL